MTVTLGEIEIARVTILTAVYQSTRRLGQSPPSSAGHQLAGGGSGSATYPVDEVHQARYDWGIGDGGKGDLEKIKTENGVL